MFGLGKPKAAQPQAESSQAPASKKGFKNHPLPGLIDGSMEISESIAYYKSALRSAQKMCLIMGCISAFCIVSMTVSLVSKEPPIYFGMSQDMKLLPMVPLSKPILNDTALKNWVGEAISASFNLNFQDWRQQLSSARQYFTKTAFTKFSNSLDREGHLPLLQQQRALMHSVVQGTPVLTRSGIVSGVMIWEFEVPLLISYETSKGRIADNAVIVVCQVQRVPTTDYPRGVALSSIVTTKHSRLNS